MNSSTANTLCMALSILHAQPHAARASVLQAALLHHTVALDCTNRIECGSKHPASPLLLKALAARAYGRKSEARERCNRVVAMCVDRNAPAETPAVAEAAALTIAGEFYTAFPTLRPHTANLTHNKVKNSLRAILNNKYRFGASAVPA